MKKMKGKGMKKQDMAMKDDAMKDMPAEHAMMSPGEHEKAMSAMTGKMNKRMGRKG